MRGVIEISSRIYGNYRLIPVFPVISVLFDYSLTFLAAGGTTAILIYEFSPVIRFVASRNLYFPFILFMMGTYYILSFLALKSLHDTELYQFGVTIVVLIGLTHIFGGLSWLFRNEFYSNWVQAITIVILAFGLWVMGYAIMRGEIS